MKPAHETIRHDADGWHAFHEHGFLRVKGEEIATIPRVIAANLSSRAAAQEAVRIWVEGGRHGALGGRIPIEVELTE